MNKQNEIQKKTRERKMQFRVRKRGKSNSISRICIMQSNYYYIIYLRNKKKVIWKKKKWFFVCCFIELSRVVFLFKKYPDYWPSNSSKCRSGKTKLFFFECTLRSMYHILQCMPELALRIKNQCKLCIENNKKKDERKFR